MKRKRKRKKSERGRIHSILKIKDVGIWPDRIK